MLNIPSSVEDPMYRYKMPAIKCKIEGRGNGIKTNICNLAEVARSLKRNPGICTKFFGVELGALSKYDEKEEKSIVNGAIPQQRLQDVLDKFIEKFVLCPVCRLPEAQLFCENSLVMGKCDACSWIGKLDNSHRIALLISKEVGNSKTKSKKASKAEKGEKKEDAKKEAKDKESKSKDKDKDKDSDEKKDKKKKKKDKDKESDDKKEKKEKKKKKKAKDPVETLTKGVVEDSDDDVEFGKVIHHLLSEVGSPLDVFEAFSSGKLLEDIKREASMMFDVEAEIFNGFALYYSKDEESQKSCKKHFPLIMKKLFDEDLVKDSEISAYFDTLDQPAGLTSEQFEYFCGCCAPFLEWLQEEEEEESSNELSSDEIEDI